MFTAGVPAVVVQPARSDAVTAAVSPAPWPVTTTVGLSRSIGPTPTYDAESMPDSPSANLGRNVTFVLYQPLLLAAGNGPSKPTVGGCWSKLIVRVCGGSTLPCRSTAQ